jgi:asparagine synthase (glutamine-hydrolysing)
MCGISGVVARRPTPGASARIPRVAEMLHHRGPDDGGFLTLARGHLRASRAWEDCDRDPEVAFVHRRLTILDLTDQGWQPMVSADGRYAIVFNGEIYNYVELREELAGSGYRFRSTGDTEVLLAAYAQWDTAAFARLVGMFALAILDIEERKVVLCRDHFGIKPLYYAVDDDALYFASELPALMEFVPHFRTVDAQRLYRYLRYGITDEDGATLLSQIRQMPAASYAEISLDAAPSAEPRAYWKLSPSPNRDISFSEAADETRRLFLENVALHLRSDVPVGSALSGGIDSSAIVCAMRQIVPHGEIHAFSYVASDSSLNEERWIDLVGKHARLTVHKVFPDSDNLLRELHALSVAQGEPFRSTSIYAQYRVFAEAAKHRVKVLLDGQGADELLGGYRSYLGVRLAQLVREGNFARASRFLRRCAALPGASPSYVVQKAAELLLPLQLQGPLRKVARRELVPAWLNASWFRRAGVAGKPTNGPTKRFGLERELVRELETTSLPALLRYEDRNSMAWSVESRVPFLTPRFVEFVLGLPEPYIIGDDGTTKRVFRAAMRGIVPNEVLDRQDKIGFATPEREWMRKLDGWVDATLSSETARAIPALDLRQTRSLWEGAAGGRGRPDFDVWRALNLIQWTEQFSARYR